MPNLIPVSLSLWAGIYNVLFALRVGAPVVVDGRLRHRRVRRARRAVRHPLDGAAAGGHDDAQPTTRRSPTWRRCGTSAASPRRCRRCRPGASTTSSASRVLNSYGQTEIGGEIVGWNAADSRGARRRPSSARSADPTTGVEVRSSTRRHDVDRRARRAVGAHPGAQRPATPTAPTSPTGSAPTAGSAPATSAASTPTASCGSRAGCQRHDQPRRPEGASPARSRRCCACRPASPTSRSSACPTTASARCRGRSSCPRRRVRLDADGARGAVPRAPRALQGAGRASSAVDALPRNEVGKVLKRVLASWWQRRRTR